jgi:hypothetical protein
MIQEAGVTLFSGIGPGIMFVEQFASGEGRKNGEENEEG